jgi:hypothetical protein
MSGTVHFRGGWNNSTLDTASPSMRARILQADAEYEAEVAREERARKQRAADQHERAVQASIAAALERGEQVDMRRALQHGVGRTHREIVEYASAQMDHEDMLAAARERAEFNRWKLAKSASMSADMSAPTEAETAELEMTARSQARASRRVAERRATDRRTVALARSVNRLGL